MSDFDPTIGRRTATDKRLHVRMTTGFFFEDHKLRDVLDPVQRMATLALLGACIGRAREDGSDGHIDLQQICRDTGLPLEFGKLLIADRAVHEADHGCPNCPQPRVGRQYVHDYLNHNRSAAQEERILERRRQGGITAANQRWEGYTPPVKEKRGPGRPRKNPVPVGPAQDLLELAAQVHADQDAAQEATGDMHPAEARARQETAKRRPGRPRKVRIFDPWVTTAANRLADLIAANDLNGKRPNVTDTWLNAIRVIHDIDKREIEKINSAIEWSQKHHFYKTIILSPQNLRKHFNAMHLQAIEEHRRRAGVRRVGGPAGPPPTVSVTGMAGMLAKQMAGTSGAVMQRG